MGALQDVISKLDSATNKVAAELSDVKAKLQEAIDAGKTPDPADLAALEAIAGRLEAMGRDPQNPFPTTGESVGP